MTKVHMTNVHGFVLSYFPYQRKAPSSLNELPGAFSCMAMEA